MMVWKIRESLIKCFFRDDGVESVLETSRIKSVFAIFSVRIRLGLTKKST